MFDYSRQQQWLTMSVQYFKIDFDVHRGLDIGNKTDNLKVNFFVYGSDRVVRGYSDAVTVM